jgi:xanthine/uracil permease
MELPTLLRRVPITVGLIDAAVATLTATLIRERLIPDNLGVLGVIAPLVIVSGFFVTAAYHDRLRVWLRPLALGSVATLIVLLLMHTQFVHSVEPYGADRGRHDFLVGYEYTEQGREWIKTLGPQSVSEYIAKAGDDRIRATWGTSYVQVAAAYSLTYLAFVLCVVLALGATELGGPQRKRRVNRTAKQRASRQEAERGKLGSHTAAG